jgi:hypothetical protein
VTDLLRSTGDFSDGTQFQFRVVRDFLSRSYYKSTSNIWISPAIVSYVAKVYSMSIGAELAKTYSLSAAETAYVQMIFALFYIGKMTAPAIAPAFLKAHIKDIGFFHPDEVTQVLQFVADTIGKPTPETIEEAIAAIVAYGSPRLTSNGTSRLNRAVLNVKFSTLYQDGQIGTIALEYPPYFLFMILLALSGVRIKLSFTMKTFNLVRKGREVFEQAIRSPSLVI